MNYRQNFGKLKSLPSLLKVSKSSCEIITKYLKVRGLPCKGLPLNNKTSSLVSPKRVKVSQFINLVLFVLWSMKFAKTVEMSFDLVGSIVQFSGSNLRKFLLTGQKKIITTEQNYKIKYSFFFKLHKSQQIKRSVYKLRHL